MQAKDLKPNSWYISLGATVVYIASTDRYTISARTPNVRCISHTPDARRRLYYFEKVGHLAFVPSFESEDRSAVWNWLDKGGDAPEVAVKFAEAASKIHDVITGVQDGVGIQDLPALPYDGRVRVFAPRQLNIPAHHFAALDAEEAARKRDQEFRDQALQDHLSKVDEVKQRARSVNVSLDEIQIPEKESWRGNTLEGWDTEVVMPLRVLRDLLARIPEA